MTQFDTAAALKIKKLTIGYQVFKNQIFKNLQIPSSTQKLTQLIVIQLVGFLVFHPFTGRRKKNLLVQAGSFLKLDC